MMLMIIITITLRTSVYRIPCINLLSLGDRIRTSIPVPTAINPNTVYTSIYRVSDSAAVGKATAASDSSIVVSALAPVSFAS